MTTSAWLSTVGVPPKATEAIVSNPVSPAHYQGFSNGAQVIDITENLNFNRGNVVKYVARAGRKDPATEMEDLLKAKFYLERELKRLALTSTKEDG